jgi:hypothetical protein
MTRSIEMTAQPGYGQMVDKNGGNTMNITEAMAPP